MYLNPEVIVITAAGVNSTLIKDFTLAYSISPGDTLTTNSSFGRVTIDNTFNKATVIMHLLGLSSSHKAAILSMQFDNPWIQFLQLDFFIYRNIQLHFYCIPSFVLLVMSLFLLVVSREGWSVGVRKTTN